MINLEPTTALIIIDVQDGFDDPMWGPRNNRNAEANIARLLAAWRASGRPIFHVQHLSRYEHLPLHPSHPGSAIKAIVRPEGDEAVITKQVNSAFIGTDLETRLRERGIKSVVITGLTTDHCVSTTARMAANLGFATIVVADATATFDRSGPKGQVYPAQQVHDLALASLNDEFAQVVDTDEVLEELTMAGGAYADLS